VKTNNKSQRKLGEKKTTSKYFALYVRAKKKSRNSQSVFQRGEDTNPTIKPVREDMQWLVRSTLLTESLKIRGHPLKSGGGVGGN